MEVFKLRDRLVGDYADYVKSFVAVRDERILAAVDEHFNSGALWPQPLIQMNPSFAPGAHIDDLVDEGVLSDQCRGIFRIRKSQTSPGERMRLHHHQEEAIRIAAKGANYVLTTGTGSGKSLTYIIPIVDAVLRNGTGKGIQAIVIYPMNALANSQQNELAKFIRLGLPGEGAPVRFARYTGQEKQDEREQLLQNPPDILLTNYVMLELILTRSQERQFISTCQDLKFLVLDELHTYRGRQGADVAMLIRRVRQTFANTALQCVGTSATLAGPGTFRQQQQDVAAVATRLFGAEVLPEHSIGETLERATDEVDFTDQSNKLALTERVRNGRPPNDLDPFLSDPLSSWIESTFGLVMDDTGDRLVRRSPRSLIGPDGAAGELARMTSVDEARCSQVIADHLQAAYQLQDQTATGFPPFAFRLHQFFSRGDTVYATVEKPDSRHISLEGQTYTPGDRSRLLFPLAFCRECGQEYYVVARTTHDERALLVPRELNDVKGEDDETSGFLYISDDHPWPNDENPDAVLGAVPNDWIDTSRAKVRIRANARKWLPQNMQVDGFGQIGSGVDATFLPAPFRFCPRCGVSYYGPQRSDFGKLATLATEGRSTATTILALTVIRQLRHDGVLLPEARKLLSFTDNRQDASLQAGHFNDFVEVGLLRGAVYEAVFAAGANGLAHEDLIQAVFDSLSFTPEMYAADANVRYQAKINTDRAFKEVLGYRIYRDLERGWRMTSPNLEQCGLLEIEYSSLAELCAADADWDQCSPVLAKAPAATRQRICKTLLDYMRRELCIKVPFLDADHQERIKAMSTQHLIAPWAIDEDEHITNASVLFPRSRAGHADASFRFLSGRSAFGQYLRRPLTFADQVGGSRISVEESESIIRELLETLRMAGLVEPVTVPGDDGVPGYQINAGGLLWRCGTGRSGFEDPVRMPNLPEEGRRANDFFVRFYTTVGTALQSLEAREHTAQVPPDERQDREDRFRTGNLPVLFASATLELGVDIASLNVVNMRNIPPTPANYAQRSGRAGRSGQPALVFSYCSTFRSHDQYFFRRPSEMVAGQVAPPRIDLVNKDLLESHLHALWLSEHSVQLGSSLGEVLDLGKPDELPLQPRVRDELSKPNASLAAKIKARSIIEALGDEVKSSGWYGENWLEHVIDGALMKLDLACERWRGLFRAASQQQALQNSIVNDHARDKKDRDRAAYLRRQAEAQIELLRNGQNFAQSDFYTYRYLASEGFLPGYNFPRLPLSAYLPGRRPAPGQRNKDDFISRSRFLAVSEFGPRALLYHEGARYRIERVILPIRGDEAELPLSTFKICGHCGYVHEISQVGGPDLCENCQEPLGMRWDNLFRLENVSTRRVDRINSDEEERSRTGFEIVSGFRFSDGDGGRKRHARITSDAGEIALLTYGDAASLWRINIGWRRRANLSQRGFLLDVERGYWAKNQDDVEDNDSPLTHDTKRVVPFVQDRKNCLMIAPHVESLGGTVEERRPFIASLQAALKSAIQQVYQLEEAELAAEAMPDRDNCSMILFYEASEGGAGVLRRLVEEPEALPRVARSALEICHFNPDTGEDLKRPPNGTQDCEAACYGCLMSYTNQMDHRVLDRMLIRGALLALASCQVEPLAEELGAEAHLDKLLSRCDSELEREWLRFLQRGGYRLPSHAQKLIDECSTRPDFYYEEHQCSVYIDGPIHDYPDRQKRDAEQQSCLEDAGYWPVRFGHQDDWQAIVQRYPSVFGGKA